MSHPKILWQEWPAWPIDDSSFGHGIHYHDLRQRKTVDLVAFIDGFGWLDGTSSLVHGFHITPNKITTPKVVAAMKRRIETLVAEKKLIGDGLISRRICACANA